VDHVPDRPTREDALTALAVLNELLAEFPFVGETPTKQSASRSVALSGLITPIVRAALSCAPMHGISATTAGTGKSHLVDTVSTLAIGFQCPVMAAGRNEEETEKRLGTVLLQGQPIVSIDNVNGELSGDFLCQAITQPTVNVRLLGKLTGRKIMNSVALFATGNNLQPTGDLVRRTLMCWMDRGEERPELHGFKADPVKAILADRGRYVGAVLTIVRAYVVAGYPSVCGPFAGFDDWNRFVRSPLVWLGCADPVDTVEQSRKGDTKLNDLRSFMAAMLNAFGVGVPKTASQIIAAQEGNKELREALGQIKPGKELNAKALGKWLSSNRNRIVNYRKIDCVENKRESHEWYICDARKTDCVDEED
jgi:putative DNA primase/helicase